MALTQIKQETSKKLGLQGKRRRAGWDTDYLELVDRDRHHGVLWFELQHGVRQQHHAPKRQTVKEAGKPVRRNVTQSQFQPTKRRTLRHRVVAIFRVVQRPS
jgi:hypothetical protein